MADNKKSWQVPKWGSPAKDVHVWFKQQIEDGKAFQEASPGATQLEEAIRVLTGEPSNELADKQKDGKYTKVRTNRAKRNLREMVNSLAEIRYNPGYHSKNKDTHNFAETLNNVGQHWYTDSFADLDFKKAIQWAGICPCGWLEICYREIPGGNGKQAIDLIPMSWFDVVMTGVPDEGDHQQAYTVTLIKDLPMYQAHALFPEHASKLKPDRETPKGWLERIKEKAAQAFAAAFETQPEKATAKNPTCRVYYQFVIDLENNKTSKTIKMGYEKKKVKIAEGIERDEDVEMPWSYDVPAVGQMVQSGYDDRGQPVYQPATPKQCRLFPGRRLLIGTDTEMIYDGPMFDWHGRVPIIKIAADTWPFGEFSMIHDVVPMHESINEIDRIEMQTVRNRMGPTLLYNARAIGPDKAKTVRTDIQGQRIGYNGQETGSQGPMHMLFDKSFNVIDAFIPEFKKYLADDMDYEMGVRDIAALSKMKLGASQDSMEKALEIAGPIVKGISRDMERSFRDLCEMFKYLVVQYMTTPEIMQIIGKDGVTPENYDYEPGNLVPSHLPGEYKEKKSIYTTMQRARWMADHVKFMMQPGTLHEIVQTAQKMLYMQLWRAGYPIDPVTLGEILRLGNVGTIEGSSMIDRWFNWQKRQLEMKAQLAQYAKEIMPEEGEDGMAPNAPKQGPKGGPKGSGGRASSGQASPQIVSKDGGARQTVKESR